MSDPINPAHYDGTACAQIGEQLTANSYQVLKYNWRLGKKDDPVIELGKSIWYLDREMKLAIDQRFQPLTASERFRHRLPNDIWFNERLLGVDAHVSMVAWALINWNRYGDYGTLIVLRHDIIKKRDEYEALATGQQGLGL